MEQIKQNQKRDRQYDKIEKLPDDAKISLTNAALLIGVARTTLYAHAKAGFIKITFTRNHKMMRVVGSEIKRYCRVN